MWQEAAACVNRMFLMLGSWMGLAINTQSGSSHSATIRVWSSARVCITTFWSHSLIFPQDPQVLYNTLAGKGMYYERISGQISSTKVAKIGLWKQNVYVHLRNRTTICNM